MDRGKRERAVEIFYDVAGKEGEGGEGERSYRYAVFLWIIIIIMIFVPWKIWTTGQRTMWNQSCMNFVIVHVSR